MYSLFVILTAIKSGKVIIMIDIDMLNADIANIFENVGSLTTFSKREINIRKINQTDFVGYVYKLKTTTIGFSTLKEIVDFIKIVTDKNVSQKIPICLDLAGGQPVDKLTMSLLECICFHVIQNLKRKIVVTYNYTVDIVTDQMKNSAFAQLGPKGYNPDKFVSEFLRYSLHRQLRQIYQSNVDIATVMSDFKTFGNMMGIGVDAANRLGKLVGEVVDNSVIHAQSSCFVDLDISTPYKKKDSNDRFYGINLTVMNFSKQYFYDGIRIKMDQFRQQYRSLKTAALFKNYQNIEDAYNYHQKYFDTLYTQKHFWIIAALQHHVSGRNNQFYTNGVGLTELIRMIHKYSDKQQCYISSGNIGIRFEKELMEYNNNTDKMVGFNESADFLTAIPDKHVLGNNKLHIPGTVYNLSFTVKESNNA